jgi:hypothetical protein
MGSATGKGGRNVQLEPEGKKRLETMKKRLAAGLPLAGMLAALAAVADVAEAQEERMPRASIVMRPREERPVMGKPVIVLPETPENPESPADGQEKPATEAQP